MMTAFIINSGSNVITRAHLTGNRVICRVVIGQLLWAWGLGHGLENLSDPEPPVSTEAAALTIEALR